MTPRNRLALRVTEALLSLVAVIGLLALPYLWMLSDAFCLSGDCPAPTAPEVARSQTVSALLVAAVVGVLVAALVNGARWRWLWHGLVASAAAASVLLFTLGVDWREVVAPDPEPVPHDPSRGVCFGVDESGPSGHCPGG